MSFRYFVGHNLIRLTVLVGRILRSLSWMASLPEQLAVIVWTTKEIDRHSKAGWDSWEEVGGYLEAHEWLDDTERDLVERYFRNSGEVLNLACGAGREALLLGQRDLRVTAYDWSPRMIAAAQVRNQESKLPIRFEAADLYSLEYPENAFDYVLLTNIAYGYFFPRQRRIVLLRHIYSTLKLGGLFIISFATARLFGGQKAISLLLKLKKYAPFNREYEPGDRIKGTFVHDNLRT